jgi:hypothetical protein
MDRRVVQATQLLTPLSRQPTHSPRIAALATSLVGFPVPVPPLLRLSSHPTRAASMAGVRLQPAAPTRARAAYTDQNLPGHGRRPETETSLFATAC